MSSESAIENAAFAVSSRLISCLVTESLLRAFYLPLNNSQHATGILVVLTTSLLNERPVITRTLRAADVLAIVPLHHPPVLKDQSIDKHGRLVALVDPLDMLPEVYELIEDSMDQSDSSERVRISHSHRIFCIRSYRPFRIHFEIQSCRALCLPLGSSEDSSDSAKLRVRNYSGESL